MGIFDGIVVDNTAAVATDSVGGSGRVKETGVYDMVIKKAWFHRAASGALGYTVEFETETKQTLKITEYATGRTGETFYVNKTTGAKEQMRGYSMMTALDTIATGSSRAFPTTEEKQIKIWDSAAKAETLQKKDVPVEWIGKLVTCLVTKEVVNKQQKDDDGKYVDVAGSVDKMFVDMYCDPVTGLTRNEKQSGITTPTAKTAWESSHPSTYVKDRRSIKEDATPAAVTAPAGDSPFGA